jgi:hypothetical protein
MTDSAVVDGFSGATPLAQAAAHETANLPSVMEMFIGTIPGSVGETSALAILIGAVILIATGIGSWKIIVSVIAGGLGMGLLMNAVAVNPVYGDARLLPSDYGRICLRSCLYGNRSGYGHSDGEGEMDLRISYRSTCSTDQGTEPCIP